MGSKSVDVGLNRFVPITYNHYIAIGGNRPVTNKQRAFALEYMVDMNATQAAIRAGYSPKTAKQQGHRLLTNVDFSSILETIEKTGTEADIAKEKEAKNTLLLTAKQEAFVREYCVDMNATQAAVRAGYSSRSAKQQGHRLLHNAGVLQTLQVKLNTKEIARKADAKQVIAHMKSIEFSNIFDYLELSGDFPVYRICSRHSKTVW